MVSAWQVYWVMQLDTIGTVVRILNFFTFVAATITTIFAINCGTVSVESCEYDWQKKHAIWATSSLPIFRKYSSLFLTLFFLFSAGNIFLPSSRTAAAMIVLPAITSDKAMDAIGSEAHQLLDLTKDALRGLAPKKADDKTADAKH